MGLFSKLFGNKKSIIEKELIKNYATLLYNITGESFKKCIEHVEEEIEMCKKQVKREKTDNLPDNYGDILILVAKEGDLKAKEIVDKAIRGGATDEDIIKYWNLHDLQRRMVVWSENIFRLSAYNYFKKEGLSEGEAVREIRKMFPMYGNPDDMRHASGDDRPLPHELRGRVDSYCKRNDENLIQEKISKSKITSFNAFIRSEIRLNNL